MTTTRFAPSPTGYLHVGNLRTALFNYLVSKKLDGTFILRLDDTDAARSKEEYAQGIKQDLEWLGLQWDRIETQSTRLDRYMEAADALRASGRLYECFETPTELDLKRKKLLNMGKPPVYDRSALKLSEAEKDELRKTRQGHWRFKLDHQRIEWTDGILGDLSIDAASVSDPVLIRGDGQFLYTLASVCDDVDYGITHVVRGSDHVTNTATQIQIIEALSGQVPSFAHHSLLTGPSGEALSKRLGSLAIRDMRTQRIEPMAFLSHLAHLGSSTQFALADTLDQLSDGFTLDSFGSAPTKYDAAELRPLTQKYLSVQPVEVAIPRLDEIGVPAEQQEAFWLTVRKNITTQADLADWWALISKGADPLIDEQDQEFVATAKALLPATPWDDKSWKQWTTAVKEATGRKGRDLFMPLRKALTGKDHGPDMSKLMPMLTKTRL